VLSPELREAARTLGVITMATVIGATRQLPGTFVSRVLISTEIVTPSSTDQNFGPNRYRSGRPIAAPRIVLITRERNAIHAALGSGSESTGGLESMQQPMTNRIPAAWQYAVRIFLGCGVAWYALHLVGSVTTITDTSVQSGL